MALFSFSDRTDLPNAGASMDYLIAFIEYERLRLSDRTLRLDVSPGGSPEIVAVFSGSDFSIGVNGGGVSFPTGRIEGLKLFVNGANFMTVTGFGLSLKTLGGMLGGSETVLSNYLLSGHDRMLLTKGDDFMSAGSGNDTMLGGRGNDLLQGGFGADRLLGEAGFDNLLGGAGNDSLFGGNSADGLFGSAGADQLLGGLGADSLFGERGKDVLTGGSGADHFRFEMNLSNADADRVKDFTRGTDKVAVSPEDTDLVVGALAASAFRKGTSAQDADDRLIYDPATGRLMFDGDGNGSGSAILIAVFENKPNLAASDFEIGYFFA